MKAKRILCFLICVFMLAAVLVSCNNDTPEEETTGSSSNPGGSVVKPGEDDTTSAADAALEKIQSSGIDISGEPFHILSRTDLEEDFKVKETDTKMTTMQEAVYNRNLIFKELFGVEVEVSTMADTHLTEYFRTDVTSTKQYSCMFSHTSWNIDLASSGYLYNFLDLEPYIDMSQSWWDQGTRGFNIADSIWFMNGSFNFDDDKTTYCLMFNKNIAERSFETNDIFYELVNDNQWTLDTFYSYANKVSENLGEAIWDENDKYGFVTTWEYGITFFYGSGLRFINCEEGKSPALTLDQAGISKATDLLGKLQDIYATEVTYWPEGGKEQIGKDIFWAGRCLFFGEIVTNVIESNEKMTDEYGVLPVPKYDQKQEKYLTWTHGISSSMVISKNVKDPKKFGTLIEAFNIISEQYVRPAFYDVVLTRKSVNDADSGPMLDIIFAGRVYDFAMYNDEKLGLIKSFKTCVNEGKTGFATEYKKVSGSAGIALTKMVRQFGKLNKS